MGTEVTVEFSLVRSDIKVVAVQSVHEIFVGNDALDILELANDALDFITSHTLELLCSNSHSFLPVKLSVGSIRLSGHGHGESLLFETVKGMS